MSYFSEETNTKNRIFEKKDDSIEDNLPAISEIFERLTGISFQYSYPWLHIWLRCNLSFNLIRQHKWWCYEK